MKHLTFGAKSVFVGDEAADALIDYAAHVAQLKTGDRIDLVGYSAEGNRITTTFLLNAGANLVAETTDLPRAEPDNDRAVAYTRQRIEALSFSADFLTGYQIAFDDEA